MIRVLHVYPQFNNAGTEMVIMNLYKNIDRTKVQFDFLAQEPGIIDADIRALGGKIYYIPNDGKRKYYRRLLRFFDEHKEYIAVHTHTHLEMGIVLKAAKKQGIRYRIAHSHNSRADLPRIVRFYKYISSYPIERHTTHFIACSKEAAVWLFPHQYNKCKIWNNGITVERFLFSKGAREEIRKKYRVPIDAKVICHVGRFARQKNHERIISILNIIMETQNDYYAFLVGTGPLLEEMKEKTKSERIIFLGNRSDIPDILSASDVFLFPSLWEGLGIVAVEAQANGLFCIASERVPKAADIGSGLFTQMLLSNSDGDWIRCIKEHSTTVNEYRFKNSQLAITSEYNIKNIADNAEKFYLSLR